jgi:hypothetical protein
VEEEDRDDICDGIRTLATDQDKNMVDEADQSHAPVRNALEILVHNATEEFGFAPITTASSIFLGRGGHTPLR